MRRAVSSGSGRSTGHIWKNGTAVRRNDGTVRVAPPLEPLAVRTISPRFLSEPERVQIADLALQGFGPTVIGKALGRSSSTIGREPRHDRRADLGRSQPFHAHALSAGRRPRIHPLMLKTDQVLRSHVVERPRERRSRQQISRALRLEHPDDAARRVATETIYHAIHRPSSGASAGRRPHRVARAGTIFVDTPARSAPAAGSHGPCRPGLTATSRPPTVPSLGTGRAT